MDEEINAPRPEPPPLRIHHLMACAAVVAVIFTLWRTYYTQMGTTSVANAVILMAIGGGLTSIGLTFAIFSVAWHLRGYAALTQPGQWLLIGFAVSMLRTVILMSLLVATRRRSFGSMSDMWDILNSASVLATYVVPFGFYLWCAWKVADTRMWRIAFVAFAFLAILSIPGLVQLSGMQWGLRGLDIYLVSYAAQTGIKACVLLAALWNDRRQKLRRYWTHWLGVGLSILVYLSSILSMVVQWIYS
jgi:hypothetical protein